MEYKGQGRGPVSEVSVVDLSVKALAREVPGAFFRLVNLDVEETRIHRGDVTVAVPEFRADQVYQVLGADGTPEWALYLECQLQPDPRLLKSWFLKYAALSEQLEIPVLLVVLYLRRGDRATFPEAYTVAVGGVINEFRFHTVRLWEEADRIRSGALTELAPLLVLCEDRPADDAIREEVALIRAAELAPEVRSELLAVAYMVGTRYLAREVLDMLFQKNEWPPLEELGMIGDYIAEKEIRARLDQIRRLTIQVMRTRFGELPPEIVNRVEAGDLETCERLFDRALRANSLHELAD